MALKVIGERVVVKANAVESVTPGGIVLPESIDKDQITGTIVAVGTGRILNDGTLSTMFLKVGDTVLANKQYGAKIKYEGELLFIFEQDNILAIDA